MICETVCFWRAIISLSRADTSKQTVMVSTGKEPTRKEAEGLWTAASLAGANRHNWCSCSQKVRIQVQFHSTARANTGKLWMCETRFLFKCQTWCHPVWTVVAPQLPLYHTTVGPTHLWCKYMLDGLHFFCKFNFYTFDWILDAYDWLFYIFFLIVITLFLSEVGEEISFMFPTACAPTSFFPGVQLCDAFFRRAWNLATTALDVRKFFVFEFGLFCQTVSNIRDKLSFLAPKLKHATTNTQDAQ